MVTDRIIEQMEKGIIPWQKPWVGGTGMAISYTSRKPYSLLNQFLLGRPGEWLTWKQIYGMGGKVKKGAKSRFVVFYSWIDEKDEQGNPIADENGRIKQYPILRWYQVFHLSDTEGIDSKLETVVPNPDIQPIEVADKVITDYVEREGKATGFRFCNDTESGEAYYSPSEDKVVVPMLTQYEIPEEYYSTTFHELTHSTMHEKRCDRKAESKTFSSRGESYSREELVAELGAAMICNRIGIEAEKAFKNSAAYIQHWMKALKNDTKMIVWASGKAEKAAKYILNESDSNETN